PGWTGTRAPAWTCTPKARWNIWCCTPTPDATCASNPPPTSATRPTWRRPDNPAPGCTSSRPANPWTSACGSMSARPRPAARTLRHRPTDTKDLIMQVIGTQLIGSQDAPGTGAEFQAIDPATGEALAPAWRSADAH